MKDWALNSFEINKLAVALRDEISGKFVQKVFEPAPWKDFLNHHIGFELYGGYKKSILHFHLNLPFVFLTVTEEKIKVHPHSSQFFILYLRKHLQGKKIVNVKALENERILDIFFEDQILRLVLIPARAGFLILKNNQIIFSSKESLNSLQSTHYNAPQVTESKFNNLNSWNVKVNELLDDYLFQLKKNSLLTFVRREHKKISKWIFEKEKQYEHLSNLPDMTRYAELLKANWHLPHEESFKKVWDERLNQFIDIPLILNLSYSQVVARYFEEGKKNKIYLQGLSDDLKVLDKKKQELEVFLSTDLLNIQDCLEWEAKLFRVQNKNNISIEKKGLRSFLSSDGFVLYAGRNLKENLYLTFKVARSNDVWMHLKARKSSHGILLTNRKSSSLEALLDLANLVLHLSGIKNKDKYELDYTFKKYVKKVKKSNEVVYTNYKTICVALDEERIKRMYK